MVKLQRTVGDNGRTMDFEMGTVGDNGRTTDFKMGHAKGTSI